MLRELSTTGSFAIRCTASIGMVSESLRPEPFWVGSAGGGLEVDISLIRAGSVRHLGDLSSESEPAANLADEERPTFELCSQGGGFLHCTPPLCCRLFGQ
jgi:hypothetical protein